MLSVDKDIDCDERWPCAFLTTDKFCTLSPPSVWTLTRVSNCTRTFRRAWLSMAELDWFLPVVILFVFVANIIFSSTAFSCSLVTVYDNDAVEQFGFWQLKDPTTQSCLALDFVGGAHRWGRAFGVMGCMLGWSLWLLICVMSILINVPFTWWNWAGVGMWIMLFFSSSLSWIGLGAPTCLGHRCGLTQGSRLLILTSCIWFIVGLILIRWSKSNDKQQARSGNESQSLSFRTTASILAEQEETNSQISSLRKIIDSVVRKEAEKEAQMEERMKKDNYRTRVHKLLDSFRTLEDEESSRSVGQSSSSSTGQSGTDTSSSSSRRSPAAGSSTGQPKIRLLQPQQVQRSKNADGTETVTTTKTTVHPDGTRVIEKNTVLVIPPVEPSGCGACMNDLCYIHDSEEEEFTDEALEKIDSNEQAIADQKKASWLPKQLPGRKERKAKNRPTSGGSMVEAVISVQPPASMRNQQGVSSEIDGTLSPRKDSKEDMVILGVESVPQAHSKRGWPRRPQTAPPPLTSQNITKDLKASEEGLAKVHDIL